MAAVRIDDEAFNDPRIELLGQLAGYNRYEAIGRLAHLWRHCTHKETSVVGEAIVRATLGTTPDHLIESDLGERVTDGVRVKGTLGRIEWLAKRRAASRSGGSQTKAKHASDPGQKSEDGGQTGAKTEPNDSPLTLTPTMDSGSFSGSGSEEVTRDGARVRSRKPADTVDGYQATVDAFHVRYSGAYGGAKPTWGAKQGAALKRLLKQHGAPEVQRRMAILFDSPPSWLKGPYDVGTLVQHFDKLVGVESAAGGPSGTVGRFDPSMNPKDDDNETPPWDL